MKSVSDTERLVQSEGLQRTICGPGGVSPDGNGAAVYRIPPRNPAASPFHDIAKGVYKTRLGLFGVATSKKIEGGDSDTDADDKYEKLSHSSKHPDIGAPKSNSPMN
jgi:hypothetical protein